MIEHNLEGRAYRIFRLNNHRTIDSFVQAFKYEFIKDPSVEEIDDALRRINQEPSESVEQFGGRVKSLVQMLEAQSLIERGVREPFYTIVRTSNPPV